MTTGARALAVIVQSGGFDRVHYALVLASATAAIGRPAILFFTGRALRALLAEGWRTLDSADDGSAPADRDADLAAKGVADFETLLAACRDLDVRMIACEMGLRSEGLEGAMFRADLTVERAGVVTLLTAAEGAVVAL
jgi:peroxiredoxin family protein